MRFPLRASLLGLALVALAAAPGMQAHLDAGGHLPPFASTGLHQDGGGGPGTFDPHIDTPFSDPGQGGGLDRVAGWYVGSAYAFIGVDGAGYWHGLPGLCDVEAVTDTGLVDPLNEESVDGMSDHGGLLPDTFNDGGVGGACHHTGWANPDYVTTGCGQYSDPSSPSFGNARAEDTASGGDVWIVTVCDSVDRGHYDGPRPGSTEGLVVCGANAVLGGDTVGGGEACGREFVGCNFQDPTLPCSVPPDVQFCGPDFIVDSFTFGAGGGHAGPGVPFAQSLEPECDAGATAAVWVLDAVLVGGGVEHVSLVAHGWIA